MHMQTHLQTWNRKRQTSPLGGHGGEELALWQQDISRLQPAAVNKSAWALPSDWAFPTLPPNTQPKLAIAAAVTGSCFQFHKSGPSNGFSILWSADTYGPCSDLVLSPCLLVVGHVGKCGQRETHTAPGAGHSYWEECMGLVMPAMRIGLRWGYCGNQFVIAEWESSK